MWKRFRAALARFAVRRAAACQRHAPQRAAGWLRLACSWTPGFGEPYVALVHLSRALQDRWGALATAQEATERFPENPDAWMLLGDASQMVFRQREALGADVIAAPAIRIEPLPDDAALRSALADLSRWRWIVFTSQNAVHVVCDSMRGWGLQPAALAAGNVVAVGPKTASALGREGVKVALVAEETTAEGVLVALTDAGGLAGARVLIPCAQGAREVLPQGLRAAGAEVEVIPVYVTTQETLKDFAGNSKGLPDGRGKQLAADILQGLIDAVTFTSPSTVYGFVDMVGAEVARSGQFAAAVIGPVTAQAARDAGMRDLVMAARSSAEGLAEALARRFA